MTKKSKKHEDKKTRNAEKLEKKTIKEPIEEKKRKRTRKDYQFVCGKKKWFERPNCKKFYEGWFYRSFGIMLILVIIYLLLTEVLQYFGRLNKTKEIMAMIRQLGSPTSFVTISYAKLLWVDSIVSFSFNVKEYSDIEVEATQ